MKFLRGVALGFWVMLMTFCVSLVAAYYIVSQTVLNPTAVKGWLNDSGVYSSLTDVILPQLTTTEGNVASSSPITQEMVQRAAKASIKPDMVRAKVEPIIDATYAWLDSKSPDIRYSVSTADITDGFLTALRAEVLAKAKSLPECTQYVAPEDAVAANCLPWYVSAEDATDAVMQRVSEQESIRSKTITPESFAAQQKNQPSSTLPDIISYFWVAQLLAIPVFILIALFLVIKRRGGGLIAIASSLMTPGLTLLVLGLLLQFGGAAFVQSIVAEGQFADVAGPLGKEIAKDLATVTQQVAVATLITSFVLGGLGIWWRKRSRVNKATKAQA